MTNKDQGQLDFGLKQSKKEGIYKIKRFGSRLEDRFSVIPFWKNFLIWLYFFSMLTTCFLAMYFIVTNYNLLPNKVPLIYKSIEQVWIDFDKFYFLFIPLIFFLIGLLNIQIIRKVYYMNKQMTMMICFILSVIYFLFLIGIKQIIILVTF